MATAALIACLSPGVWSQIGTFEVASIRLNKSGTRGGSIDFSRGGERFTATNMPLGALVLTAYNITVRQISGGGEFLSEKYDVVAKAEHPVSAEEMTRMLRALLQARFKMVVRRETREVPVYALIVGKNGPKLRRSEAPENARPTPRNVSLAGGAEPARGHLAFRNESMPDFAWALSRTGGIGDRVVVDNTGPPGSYDFELTFGHESDGGDPPPLFTALQEQLGLKLESRKAPVEFVIIEHLERPSAN